jgi:hypothetical protein
MQMATLPEPVLVPASLNVRPQTWAAIAKGGMWDADIVLTGPVDELAGLTSWIGYIVEIVNDRGTPVWWGDIATVQVTDNGVRKGISLDRLANRVQLRYTQKQPGGKVDTLLSVPVQNGGDEPLATESAGLARTGGGTGNNFEGIAHDSSFSASHRL